MEPGTCMYVCDLVCMGCGMHGSRKWCVWDVVCMDLVREVASTSPTDKLSVGMNCHWLAHPQLPAPIPPPGRPMHRLEIFPGYYIAGIWGIWTSGMLCFIS